MIFVRMSQLPFERRKLLERVRQLKPCQPLLDRTLLNEVRCNGPCGGACDMGVNASHAADYHFDFFADFEVFFRRHFASIIPKASDDGRIRLSTISLNRRRQIGTVHLLLTRSLHLKFPRRSARGN